MSVPLNFRHFVWSCGLACCWWPGAGEWSGAGGEWWSVLIFSQLTLCYHRDHLPKDGQITSRNSEAFGNIPWIFHQIFGPKIENSPPRVARLHRKIFSSPPSNAFIGKIFCRYWTLYKMDRNISQVPGKIPSCFPVKSSSAVNCFQHNIGADQNNVWKAESIVSARLALLVASLPTLSAMESN